MRLILDWFEDCVEWLFERFLKEEPETCDHNWYVYTTITSEVAIQVQCPLCRSWGKIIDPTEEEWSRAYDEVWKWKQTERIIPEWHADYLSRKEEANDIRTH